MTLVQESLDFTYEQPTPKVEVVLANTQEAEYEQLTIPYANEADAVAELLTSLGNIAAKKIADGELSEEIMAFNRFTPEKPRRVFESDGMRRARTLLHDIEYAKEVIVSNNNDLDKAITTLRKRYNQIDGRLSDDVLPSQVGSRERPTIWLIEDSRDPFNNANMLKNARDIQPHILFSNHSNAVSWLFANMERLRELREPLPWTGTETEIYRGDTILQGQIAPHHDYIWMGHIGKVNSMGTYDFIQSLLPPYSLRKNDPWA